jgi:4-hydroxythreonine-4-phosphate dehydrogenase
MTAALRNASRARKPSRLPPVAVTMGDPAGIGPDITLMSWHQRMRHRLPPFVVYADPEVLGSRARALALDVPLAVVDDAGAASSGLAHALPVVPVEIGRDAAQAGTAAVVASIERAAAAVTGGEAVALVTNPITKRALDLAHLPYPGHTEFLAELALRLCGGTRPRPVMMLAAEELKVVPATVHIPLAAVPGALTRPLLTETIRITAAALSGDFGIANPRIAVAGLNPHAGEDGLIGREDTELIAPVVKELAAEGLAVTGPHSADTLFHAEARAGYDAAIAMYHDQALIPIKTLAFDRGVNVTLGLPFVRTSPDHGTAFALAGTGKARPGSFIAALRLAAELGQRRAETSDRRIP